VRGDGEFDILDVQELFDELESGRTIRTDIRDDQKV
jgi:hypothetical protein